jgi:hypothetical protein
LTVILIDTREGLIDMIAQDTNITQVKSTANLEKKGLNKVIANRRNFCEEKSRITSICILDLQLFLIFLHKSSICNYSVQPLTHRVFFTLQYDGFAEM